MLLSNVPLLHTHTNEQRVWSIDLRAKIKDGRLPNEAIGRYFFFLFLTKILFHFPNHPPQRHRLATPKNRYLFYQIPPNFLPSDSLGVVFQRQKGALTLWPG